MQCCSCNTNIKSKKKLNIDLLNQNQDIFRFRLTKDEKIEYTEIFFSNAIEENVYKKDFPLLLGMLGTDIAINFAFKIFDTFSSSKEYITLQEYLKYVDVYHHGDDNERCLITFKLMDVNNDGNVNFDSFQEYLNLIISAIKKVHPLSDENLISKKEMKALFNKISHNKPTFTFDEFKHVFINKPELLSWIDYFKNNDDDITLLINKNIKQLITILLKLFKNIFCLTSQFEKTKKEADNDFELFEKICVEIKKFTKAVDKMRETFIDSHSFINIRNIFDDLKNTFNKAYTNNIIAELENDLKEFNSKVSQNNQNNDILIREEFTEEGENQASNRYNPFIHKINEHFKSIKNSIHNNDFQNMDVISENDDESLSINIVRNRRSFNIKSKISKHINSIDDLNSRSNSFIVLNRSRTTDKILGNNSSRLKKGTSSGKYNKNEVEAPYITNYINDIEKLNLKMKQINNHTDDLNNCNPLEESNTTVILNEIKILDYNEEEITDYVERNSEFNTVAGTKDRKRSEGTLILSPQAKRLSRLKNKRKSSEQAMKQIKFDDMDIIGLKIKKQNKSEVRAYSNTNIAKTYNIINSYFDDSPLKKENKVRFTSNFFNSEKNNLNIQEINQLKENNKLIKNQVNLFYKNFGVMSETCIHIINWMNISYNWIESKKIKHTLKHNLHQSEIDMNKHINNIHINKHKNINSTTASPFKIKSKKVTEIKNKLKTTDVNFKLLIKIIMGIQLAAQNTSNINLLDHNHYDLNDFLQSNSYTIESSGSRKRENYFISEFAPVIFNNIRKMYNISKETYISSISPQEFITEMMISSTTIIEQLVSTGKSGSMFYYTKDGRFIIKTITKEEFNFLRNILKDYFMHLKNNVQTLLPKFYGCYKLIKKIHQNKERIYFITMDNIFSTSKEIQLRYDLKGSKIGRQVLKDKVIKKGEKYQYALKDLDFEYNTGYLNFGEIKRKQIINQIEADTKFLASKQINDYSLLVGIHSSEYKRDSNNSNLNIRYTSSSKKNKDDDLLSNERTQGRYSIAEGKFESINKISPKKVHTNSTIKKPIAFINSEYLGNDELKLSSYSQMCYSEELSDESKGNISIIDKEAKNRLRNLDDGGISSLYVIQDDKGVGSILQAGKEIYYMGIIDILTEFKAAKVCEYVSKSIFYCSQDMSCIPPIKYKERFNKYFQSKFK